MPSEQYPYLVTKGGCVGPNDPFPTPTTKKAWSLFQHNAQIHPSDIAYTSDLLDAQTRWLLVQRRPTFREIALQDLPALHPRTIKYDRRVQSDIDQGRIFWSWYQQLPPDYQSTFLEPFVKEQLSILCQGDLNDNTNGFSQHFLEDLNSDHLQAERRYLTTSLMVFYLSGPQQLEYFIDMASALRYVQARSDTRFAFFYDYPQCADKFDRMVSGFGWPFMSRQALERYNSFVSPMSFPRERKVPHPDYRTGGDILPDDQFDEWQQAIYAAYLDVMRVGDRFQVVARHDKQVFSLNQVHKQEDDLLAEVAFRTLPTKSHVSRHKASKPFFQKNGLPDAYPVRTKSKTTTSFANIDIPRDVAVKCFRILADLPSPVWEFGLRVDLKSRSDLNQLLALYEQHLLAIRCRASPLISRRRAIAAWVGDSHHPHRGVLCRLGGLMGSRYLRLAHSIAHLSDRYDDIVWFDSPMEKKPSTAERLGPELRYQGLTSYVPAAIAAASAAVGTLLPAPIIASPILGFAGYVIADQAQTLLSRLASGVNSSLAVLDSRAERITASAEMVAATAQQMTESFDQATRTIVTETHKAVTTLEESTSVLRVISNLLTQVQEQVQGFLDKIIPADTLKIFVEALKLFCVLYFVFLMVRLILPDIARKTIASVISILVPFVPERLLYRLLGTHYTEPTIPVEVTFREDGIKQQSDDFGYKLSDSPTFLDIVDLVAHSFARFGGKIVDYGFVVTEKIPKFFRLAQAVEWFIERGKKIYIWAYSAWTGEPYPHSNFEKAILTAETELCRIQAAQDAEGGYVVWFHKDPANLTAAKSVSLTFRALYVNNLSKDVQPGLRAIMERCVRIVNTIDAAVVTEEISGRPRKLPVWISLVGGAGTGKTRVAAKLQQAIYTTTYRVYKDPQYAKDFDLSCVFSKNQAETYYDGYKGQRIWMIDDLFQQCDPKTVEPLAMSIITLMSTEKVDLASADLNTKNRLKADPDYLITTRNEIEPKNLSIRDPTVLYARQTGVFDVKVHKHTSRCRLDSQGKQVCCPFEIPDMLDTMKLPLYLEFHVVAQPYQGCAKETVITIDGVPTSRLSFYQVVNFAVQMHGAYRLSVDNDKPVPIVIDPLRYAISSTRVNVAIPDPEPIPIYPDGYEPPMEDRKMVYGTICALPAEPSYEYQSKNSTDRMHKFFLNNKKQVQAVHEIDVTHPLVDEFWMLIPGFPQALPKQFVHDSFERFTLHCKNEDHEIPHDIYCLLQSGYTSWKARLERPYQWLTDLGCTMGKERDQGADWTQYKNPNEQYLAFMESNSDLPENIKDSCPKWMTPGRFKTLSFVTKLTDALKFIGALMLVVSGFRLIIYGIEVLVARAFGKSEKDLQAQSGRFAGGQQIVRPRTLTARPQVVLHRPSPQSLTVDSGISRVIRENQIHVNFAGKEAWILGLGDRVFVTNRHMTTHLEDDSILVLNNTGLGSMCSYKWADCILIDMGNPHLTYFAIPGYPAVRNISSHFLNSITEGFPLHRVEMVLAESKKGPSVQLNHECSPDWSILRLPVMDCDIQIRKMPNADGMCGLAYYTTEGRPQPFIAGIHGAGYSKDQLSCACSILKQEVEDAIQLYRNATGESVEFVPRMDSLQIPGPADPLPSTPGVHYQGAFSDKTFFLPVSSKIIPTEFHPDHEVFDEHGKISMDHKPTRSPAIFKPHDGINPISYVMNKYGMTKGLPNISGPVQGEWYSGLDFSELLPPNYNPRIASKLETYEDVINGGVTIDKIDLDKSSGYGYTENNLSRLQVLYWKGLPNPAFIAECQKLEKQLECHIVPMTVINSTKDELLPNEDIATGKVRVFCIAELKYVVVAKRYFNRFQRELEKEPWTTPISVGLNAHGPEWTLLYNRLRSKSPTVMAGDFSGFEYTLPPDFIEEFIRFVNFACPASPSEQKIRANFIRSTIPVYHAFMKRCFYTAKGNSSGNRLTALYNSFINWIIHRCFWRALKLSDKEWKEDTACAFYGDDSVVAVRNHPEFNMQSMSQFALDIGMYYTSFDKSETHQEYADIHEIEYLKRKFRVINDYAYAPLRWASVMETPMWAWQNAARPVDDMANQLRSVLLELRHYSQEHYDKYFKIANRWALRTGACVVFDPYNLAHAKLILPGEFAKN